MISNVTPIKIAMLVVDANDVKGSSRCDKAQLGPVLHTAVHNLLEGLSSRKELQIEVVYGKQNPSEGENRWEGNIHYCPIKYRPWPIPGIGGGYFARAWRLLQWLRENPSDVVHAQGTERESGFVAAICGKVSVLTLHGNFRKIARRIQPAVFSYYWINALIERFVIKRVAGVICISSDTRKSLEGLPCKTWIIPNAVSPLFFEVNRKPQLSPKITCIGDIGEIKNQMVILKAAEKIHENFPHAEFHFYGNIHSQSYYAGQFLAALKNQPNCIYHGCIPPLEIPDVLATTSILVLPSKEENFGLALAEAMAAGVPVIGSNNAGILDVIRENHTGLLFSPDNADELAEKLSELLSNPHLAKKLADAAECDAKMRFSPQAVADAHHAAYLEIANHHA